MRRFPIPELAINVFLIALALVVTTSAYGFGATLIAKIPADELTPLESFLFSTVTGFGVLGLVMFAAGIFTLWTRVGAVAIVAIGLILAWQRREKLREWAGGDLAGRFPSSPLFLVLAGGLLSLIIAFAPITYYDSLVYHFALPQFYVHARRWIGDPQLIYSAFPQGMEMLWTLGLLLANDTLANLIGWILSALGVAAVYSFGKRYFGQTIGLWAAAFLSVMPAFLLLSSGGYVDAGLTVYVFLSFYALCLWKNRFSVPLLLLSGLLAGFALGAKYTAAIPLGVGAILLIKEVHPKTIENVSKYVVLYIITALIAFLPWMLKNIHYVGNPVFPFFYSWTATPKNPWMNEAAAGYFLKGLAEYKPQPVWHLFKLLWDIGVHGLNFGGGMDVLGDLGWTLLVAFLPTIWLAKKKSPALTTVILYTLIYFVAWGMSRPVLRFLLPLAPLAALAAAFGYEEGVKKQFPGFQAIARAVLALFLISNAKLFFDVTDVLSSFRVPLGQESRTDYLARMLDYYGAAGFVNGLPEGSLTYVVGDQRAYYYNRPVWVTPVFNTNLLTQWANSASSANDLAAALKAKHITHLLINHSEFARLEASYHLFPFTEKGERNWNTLCSRLAKLVYRDRHCDVLALAPAEAT